MRMTKKNMENGEGEKKKLNSGNMVKVRKVLGEGEDRPCSSGFLGNCESWRYVLV